MLLVIAGNQHQVVQNVSVRLLDRLVTGPTARRCGLLQYDPEFEDSKILLQLLIRQDIILVAERADYKLEYLVTAVKEIPLPALVIELPRIQSGVYVRQMTNADLVRPYIFAEINRLHGYEHFVLELVHKLRTQLGVRV